MNPGYAAPQPQGINVQMNPGYQQPMNNTGIMVNGRPINIQIGGGGGGGFGMRR
jgi:hypothetical protein